MKPKTPLQSAHLEAALRWLAQAETELRAAGEGFASMKVGAVLRGLK